MARVDLDAALAAQRETTEPEPHVVTFRGRDFTIPLEAPFAFLEACMYGRTETQRAFLAVRAILGEEYDQFVQCRPSVQEATLFTSKVAELWGLGEELGESEASGGSSTPSAKPSRQTSNGSTPSTSGKRRGAKKPSVSDD